MPFTEEYRRPFRAPCACGQGFVRLYKVYERNEYGHERESETPLEIHCDYCKLRYYHVPTPFTGGDLLPIGLSYPKRVPDLDRKYRLTGDESFIRSHSREVIEAMVADMETHRFMDHLEYGPAFEYAYENYILYKKKSLKPLIQVLRSILSNFDSIEAGYLKKKPYIDAHDALVEEYNARNTEVFSRSHSLSFEFDEEQYQIENKQSAALQNQYANMCQPDSNFENITHHESCKVDSTGHYWDTLHIEKCIDPHCVIEKKLFSTLTETIVVKKYLCKCTICGNEIEAYSSDFEIRYEDGKGFYPAVQCGKCHEVKSFEAKAMDILNSLGVAYAREVSFDGLISDYGYPLRFDFAVFSPGSHDESICFLLELQGPHHYKPGYYDEFGNFKDCTSMSAKAQEGRQKRNDGLKRQYCAEHKIPLETIKYTESSNDKLEDQIVGLLSKYGAGQEGNDLPFTISTVSKP